MAFNFEKQNFAKMTQTEWYSDIVIFYSVFYAPSSTTIAFASACKYTGSYLDSNEDIKVMAGKIMFNLKNINLDDHEENDFKYILKTSVHELMHVFSFNSNKVKNFQ